MTSHRIAPKGLDFYETPAGTAWHGASILLDITEARTVADAGCGAGALTKAIYELGAKPVPFDVDPRFTAAMKIDVLKDRLPVAEACLTNPPFGIWREFVDCLLRDYTFVCALGPVTLLDTIKPLPTGLSGIHMTPRPRFIGHDHQAPMPHAWFVFRNPMPKLIPPLITCDTPTRDEIRRLNRLQRNAEKVG